MAYAGSAMLQDQFLFLLFHVLFSRECEEVVHVLGLEKDETKALDFRECNDTLYGRAPVLRAGWSREGRRGS